MYVRACRPAFARPCVGYHKSISLMSSSLLLQQCPACLVRLTWIVFVIGGRWLYSWCIVGCCLHDPRQTVSLNHQLSSNADSMEFPESLSLSVPIIHRSEKVFKTASNVRAELMYLSLCLSINTGVSICRCPQENIVYKFRSYSSRITQYVPFVLLGWFVRLEVGGHTTVFYGMLKIPRSILVSSHQTYLAFSPCVSLASMWYINTWHSLCSEEIRFILSKWSDLHTIDN